MNLFYINMNYPKVKYNVFMINVKINAKLVIKMEIVNLVNKIENLNLYAIVKVGMQIITVQKIVYNLIEQGVFKWFKITNIVFITKFNFLKG